MSIESVLDAVNGFGNGVTSAVTTIITINYFIGENTVRMFSIIFGYIKSATICLLQAIQIALEDLGVFLMESTDSFVYTMEFIFSMIDASLTWIFSCYLSTKATIMYIGNAISAGCGQVLNSVSVASQNFGHAISLFGSSVILLVSLIPQACHFLYSSLISFVLGVYNYSLHSVTATVDSISNAPIETFLGLIGAIVIAISLFRLTKRLIQNNSISTAQVLRFSLQAFCFIYMNIIKCVVLCIRGIVGMVKVTLTHLHVTRFHHAGDSDAEEEVDNQGLVGHYDESDDNENERMTDKRRSRRAQTSLNQKSMYKEIDESIEDELEFIKPKPKTNKTKKSKKDPLQTVNDNKSRSKQAHQPNALRKVPIKPVQDVIHNTPPKKMIKPKTKPKTAVGKCKGQKTNLVDAMPSIAENVPPTIFNQVLDDIYETPVKKVKGRRAARL